MLSRENRGAVAWLTLDRPDKLNAMPRSFWGELTSTLSDIEADDAIRVVVFHGAGRCFSVGGDIEDFGEIGGVADRRAYMREALGAYKVLEALPKPTIAAVHGHALGGGAELTLVCDIVIADETARFGTPEAAVGLVPGLGVVRGLSQVNLHWMKYMVMTGLPLDAQEALTAGLVNKVVPAGEHVDRRRRAREHHRHALAARARRRQGDPQPRQLGRLPVRGRGDLAAAERRRLQGGHRRLHRPPRAGVPMIEDFWLADDVRPLGQMLLHSAQALPRTRTRSSSPTRA